MTDRTGELVAQYAVGMTDKEMLDRLIAITEKAINNQTLMLDRILILEREVVNLKSTVAYMIGD